MIFAIFNCIHFTQTPKDFDRDIGNRGGWDTQSLSFFHKCFFIALFLPRCPGFSISSWQQKGYRRRQSQITKRTLAQKNRKLPKPCPPPTRCGAMAPSNILPALNTKECLYSIHKRQYITFPSILFNLGTFSCRLSFCLRIPTLSKAFPILPFPSFSLFFLPLTRFKVSLANYTRGGSAGMRRHACLPGLFLHCTLHSGYCLRRQFTSTRLL